MASETHTGAGESLGPHNPPANNGDAPAAEARASHTSAAPASAPPPPAGEVHALPARGEPAAAPHQRPSRRLIYAAVAIVLLAAGTYYGVPIVARALETVSTDDAYVNGHVTYVAARVPGQVVDVFVDDNYRVRKGQVLLTLDKTPYQVIYDEKKALVDVAQANLTVAEDEFRAQIGKTRAARFKLQHAIEDVNNQEALLKANVAKLVRADADYQRAVNLEKTPGVISGQQVDEYKQNFRVAQEQVYQTRVSLGLPREPEKGGLEDVPPDLNQTFSTVREAVAELQESAAALGIVPTSFNLTPDALIAEFYRRDAQGNVDKIYEQLIAQAPSIKFATAKLAESEHDLAQAKLNLDYCTVYAEIDGVVTRRDVNPGNNIIAGQSVMAVRSLTEIWIDANFKETQLANLRIGQAADLDVDMYGSHQMFKGRISGFTMGTGSTLAILPAENATGNFVKVVQRLPVRIEVVDYDPEKKPLFIGLSVTPYVYYKKEATGPNAGKFLQPIEVVSPMETQENQSPRSSGSVPEKLPPPITAAGKPEKLP